MKVLSLHQPWASLCLPLAPGEKPVKTIETRGWSTKYRGPLALASTKTAAEYGVIGDYRVEAAFEGVSHLDDCQCEEGGISMECSWRAASRREVLTVRDGLPFHELPLGVILGTVNLVDVVPIVDWSYMGEAPYVRQIGSGSLMLRLVDEPGGDPLDITDQLPYGDFSTNGKQRYAHIYEDARLTTERCPGCGGAGIDYAPQGYGGFPVSCPTCNGKGTCPPIPVRGRQGLWEWTPNA